MDPRLPLPKSLKLFRARERRVQRSPHSGHGAFFKPVKSWSGCHFLLYLFAELAST